MRKYSVEVPKLDFGVNEESFEIESSFFEAFEHSPVEEGEVLVKAQIERFKRHLDCQFHFSGKITLNCDRCLEPYPYDLDFEQRLVFTFDEDLEFDTDEVHLINEDNPQIELHQDFFEFISLQVPLRKVPEPEVHLCPPEVLALLGLTDEEEAEEETEEGIDPRWAALKDLKNKGNNN